MSEPKRQAAITAVYDKLHENKLGAHWLWCVIEKIAAGESEEEAMREYGYYSRADGAESDESAGDLHIAYLAGFADGKKARPAAPTEAKPAAQPICEGCGKTIPEHDALLRCKAEATQQASGEREVLPDYSGMSREALERHAQRMAQTMGDDRAWKFYRKHADGPMLPPSCLCCGQLPGEVAIKHLELPGIVVCKKCRDAVLSTPAQQDAVDAERYRRLRRGQHWSVIDGIGNVLRGDDLDAAINAKKVGA